MNTRYGEIQASQQESFMNILRRYISGFKVDRLADLIVQAKSIQIRFRSEEHFFRLLGLPQNAVPVLIDDNRARMAKVSKLS
jgi:hypothetical protein